MSNLEIWTPLLGKDWINLSEETPDLTQADEAKKQRSGASHHFGSLAQGLHLTTLAGCGSSMENGTYCGPSMSDLMVVAQDAKHFAEAATLCGYEGEDTPANVEDFLSKCERVMQLPTRSEAQVGKLGLTDAQRKHLETFVKDAKNKIRDRCDIFSGPIPTDKSILSLDAHKKFLRCFARRSGRKPRLQLFTTNYDLCFEKAASETGFVVMDGFSFSFPRRFSSLHYELEIAQRKGQNSEGLEPIDNALRLFKLHGSVNWDHVDGGVAQNDKPTNPCLIHPASTKYQHAFEQPYLEMVSHYLEALRQPDQTLLVIGFGFADAHLTAPIQSTLESNNRFRMVVVDPFLKNHIATAKAAGAGFHGVLSRWMDENDERLTLFNGTFKQFMDLVPRIHKPSNAEVLADAVQRIARQSVGASAL